MYSQIDIRYSVSDTIDQVKSLIHAFPGNLTLCLENATLYQYKEYAEGEPIPAPDDIHVIQTADDTLLSRWIAIDTLTSKCLYGDITLGSWSLDNTNNVYNMLIQLPNTISGFFIKFIDNTNKEVYVEDVTEQSAAGKITTVTCTVGSIPDCRFTGKYLLYFDKLV